MLEFPVIAAPPLETVKAPVLNVPVMLEFPVMLAPPLETVKAPVLNVPVILEFPVMVAPPLETVKVDEDDNPVHTIVFVESKPIAYFPNSDLLSSRVKT